MRAGRSPFAVRKGASPQWTKRETGTLERFIIERVAKKEGMSLSQGRGSLRRLLAARSEAACRGKLQRLMRSVFERLPAVRMTRVEIETENELALLVVEPGPLVNVIPEGSLLTEALFALLGDGSLRRIQRVTFVTSYDGESCRCALDRGSEELRWGSVKPSARWGTFRSELKFYADEREAARNVELAAAMRHHQSFVVGPPDAASGSRFACWLGDPV